MPVRAVLVAACCMSQCSLDGGVSRPINVGGRLVKRQHTCLLQKRPAQPVVFSQHWCFRCLIAALSCELDTGTSNSKAPATTGPVAKARAG